MERAKTQARDKERIFYYLIMAAKNKKFYITTSIAYANAFPHIGFALEAVQADVIARHRRFLGEDVFFLTGVDEHGLKVERAAAAIKKSPEEFTEEVASRFKALMATLNLSNDYFIRTTDKEKHWPAARKAWFNLKANEDIYKKKYKGLYCFGCEAFIKKRDLKDGECPVHRIKPEIIEEDNYFFKLSKYSEPIKGAIINDEIKIIPSSCKKEMLHFLERGLEDISFSRSRNSLKWGIPVPDDETQTIYVWADALVNYLSAVDYEKGGKMFEYWPANIHCVGKDIQKFHCLIWPGMLLSLGLPLPKMIFVHGFITASGQKMSKMTGNVVDPFQLVEMYGTDAVRYYLLREIPPTQDGDFSREKFEQRYNSDLAFGLGNLASRILTLAATLGSAFRISEVEREFQAIIKDVGERQKEALEELKFNVSLEAIWELIGFCDKYIDKERPWEKSEQQALAIGSLLVALANIAFFLKPFLPATSERIFRQLGAESGKARFFEIKKEDSLFPKI